MARDINEALAAFGPDDYTVRLVRAVCGVVPFAPELTPFRSIEEHVLQLDPKAKKPQVDRCKEIAAGDEAQRALWIANAMDTADSGITMLSGIKGVVSLYQSKQGERLDALETDPQQAADAVLKGLALSYLIWKLFPGGPIEKVAAFRALPSGQALAFYYATVELGLPFADNALTSGGTLLQTLYSKTGTEQVEKFAAIAGPEAAEGATGVMAQLMGPVDGIVKMASGSLSAIAGAASSHLPVAMNVGDKVAGVVASAADAMPVYRYLGARVVAEACAKRALAETPVDKPVGASNNPAMDEVKYTTKKADKNDITVPAPPAKRGWCLIFVMMIAGTGASAALSAAAAGAWLLG